MLLHLDHDANTDDITALQADLKDLGLTSVLQQEGARKALAVIHGVDEKVTPAFLKALPLVHEVSPFKDNFKLAGRSFKQSPSEIDVNGVTIGGGAFTIMAGPCSIESQEQITAIAEHISRQGATLLRGGAFKPRTSPYDFQGLGETGLRYLSQAAQASGLRSVSEVLTAEDVPLVEHYVDMLQIGARNMQNFSLLKAAGRAHKPVLLKRGLSATYKEFLCAAEYIMSEGNPNVVLCERGIRTFETQTRNTLDIAAVPFLQEKTHLPIIIDPSHSVGIRRMVPPMAQAALAVRSDGIIVEVHTTPDHALSDSQQTISVTTFATMVDSLRRIGEAVDLPVNDAQTVEEPI